MLQYQTFACLHDIPVVRSSTGIIQTTYTKAKDSSALIRVPCNLAEYVADKSLKIASAVTNPIVKPFRGPVEVIDNYAAKKIRLIESKYPVITTPTEDVVNTFNAKTETVRNAVSTVKKSTTDKIQHGKETVSTVASATVNKATGFADSIYTFCGSHVPRIETDKYWNTKRLTGCFSLKSNRIMSEILELIQGSLTWCRIMMFFLLLRIKRINDNLLINLGRVKGSAFLQRILVTISKILERVAVRVQPDDLSMDKFNRSGKYSRIYSSRDSMARPSNVQNPFQKRFNGPTKSEDNDFDLDELHQRLGSKGTSVRVTEVENDQLNELDFTSLPSTERIINNTNAGAEFTDDQSKTEPTGDESDD